MISSLNNIEAIARDICLKTYSCQSDSIEELATDIDRFWHCVAAELESGLIDGAGNRLKEFSLEEGIAAYRDWCQRHPESKGA
jgi:hypothetical protein